MSDSTRNNPDVAYLETKRRKEYYKENKERIRAYQKTYWKEYYQRKKEEKAMRMESKASALVKNLVGCTLEDCSECDYKGKEKCDKMLMDDAAEMIAEQDERIAIMTENDA